MLAEAVEVAVIALAVAATSFTISKTEIFKPFRTYLMLSGKSWLSKLFSCPYCVSHWIAGGATLIFQPRLTGSFWIFDMLATWMAIVALSAFWIGRIAETMHSLQPRSTDASSTKGTG